MNTFLYSFLLTKTKQNAGVTPYFLFRLSSFLIWKCNLYLPLPEGGVDPANESYLTSFRAKRRVLWIHSLSMVQSDLTLHWITLSYFFQGFSGQKHRGRKKMYTLQRFHDYWKVKIRVVFFCLPYTQHRFVELIAQIRLPDGGTHLSISSDSLLQFSGQTIKFHSEAISRWEKGTHQRIPNSSFITSIFRKHTQTFHWSFEIQNPVFNAYSQLRLHMSLETEKNPTIPLVPQTSHFRWQWHMSYLKKACFFFF